MFGNYNNAINQSKCCVRDSSGKPTVKWSVTELCEDL